MERWINFAQIFASIGLGIAYFLPFSQSQGSNEVNYAGDEWFLFFWAIPVVFILYKLSNRWLKAIFCVFSSIGGLIPFVLLTFSATFKRNPLVGFHIAQLSIGILVVCWLILSMITLTKARTPEAKTSAQTHIEKLILYALLGGFATLIAVAVGWMVVMKIPVLHAQYVKSSNNPEITLDAFFHALVDDDLDLAKELATPVLRKRLDEWKIESQYTALHCPYSRFLESNSSSSRPLVTYTATHQAVSKIMNFECWYGDRASLSLWGATLESNGHEWLIIDWKKICAGTSKLSSVKCYP